MAGWRRFDTLFLRLFLLMWLTLVASQLVAWWVTTRKMEPPPTGFVSGRPPEGRPPLPVLPSLPPGGPIEALQPQDHIPRSTAAPRLPARALWVDYALRALVIALGAALGARWLSAPMRRLVCASRELGDSLARGRAPLPLDEDRGTAEVRQAARVFNQMAQQLKQQFDTRGLHMAAVSHDLRTPLTRLRMRLESAPLELATAAAAEIREMDQTIEHSLAVLREQQGSPAAPPLDVGALLQALADDEADAGRELPLVLPPQRLRARVHPAALRRIVGNLVANARLHGGGCVALALAAAPGQVVVTVDDNGPGIPTALQEQACVPWVRLQGDKTLASVHPAGQGLGLAIARDLAEHEGGSLLLTNRPTGGLRAMLALPAA